MDTESKPEVRPRCERCFGPMPCEAHKNVRQLQVFTSHDLTATEVLAAAHNSDLDYVVIVGMTKDGDEYFGSSVSDAAESIYALQRGLWKVNKLVDGERLDIGDEEK